ncbi:MAG: ribosome biogenesis GTP-binding protein YihA/YsxC [Labilithrix sp.]|nr:ribosome biogenesis GTP-binding protein YihA/YsxC [Labilithrix sp.]MCW5813782.1 ribosome biogenesis GTP-binding protein YihA/YsxC [Labilithrix sp.]
MADPKADKPKASADVRIAAAEFVAGAHARNQIPASATFEDAPEVAFAGKSNVGKSSLLNMVLARKSLARTSNTPGRTRQVNFFDVKLAQPPVPRIVFVDLPGYGYAKVSKSESHGWKDLIEGYLEQRPTLKAVYVLVDVRRGVEEDDEDLLEYAASLSGAPRVALVVTKLDKLARSAQKPALAKLGAGKSVQVIGTSAETRDGREALWKSILSACGVPSRG